jgi:hypothetical protein
VPPANRTLINATLPNGAAVKIEVESTGAAQDVAALKTFKLEEIDKAIAGFAELTRKASSKVSPDSMEVEFGLNLGLESGKLISILAHARSEASLTVRLRWHGQVKNAPESEFPDARSGS